MTHKAVKVSLMIGQVIIKLTRTLLFVGAHHFLPGGTLGL